MKKHGVKSNLQVREGSLRLFYQLAVSVQEELEGRGEGEEERVYRTIDVDPFIVRSYPFKIVGI